MSLTRTRSLRAFLALAACAALGACSHGGNSPLPATDAAAKTPLSVTTNENGTTTVGGSIVAIKSPTEFEINAGSGCGYLNIYTTSSTSYTPSASKPAVGEYASSTGTGNCASSLTASSVALEAASTPAPAGTTVRGTIVAVKSAGEFEINAGSGCGYLNVFTTASTSVSPSGSKPAVGEYSVDTGSGGCATSLAATTVSLSTSSSPSPSPAPSTAPTATPTSTPTSTPLRPSKIEVIIMENYAYSQVVGSSAAPYINSMASNHLLFTNSHAITHPSEPNYMALFAGTTEGLTSDACPVNYSGSNLASELHAAGRTFELFAEQLPSDDSTSCYAAADSSVASGYLYWRKHDPAANFPFVSGTETQPWSGTSTNFGNADVSFIVPNICDDMHDCGVAAGDAWASKNIPAIESYNAAHNGLLIFTFDEAEYDSTNHIVTIFDGLGLHGQSSQNINHYNVLRYIEDTFGLPALGNSASASAITL